MNRQKIDVRNLWNHLRVIDKDVPRTDRDLEYFKSVLKYHHFKCTSIQCLSQVNIISTYFVKHNVIDKEISRTLSQHLSQVHVELVHVSFNTYSQRDLE